MENPRCDNCSNCLKADAERDVTRQAGQIVACVLAMQGKYGKATLSGVLSGKRSDRIREKQLDKLSAFGCLKAEGEENIRTMIEELIADDVLAVTAGDYPKVKAGPRALEMLRGDEPVRMTLGEPGQQTVRPRVKAKPVIDKALFSRLAALRREIAEEQHVPPFIIFTNATLRDMVHKRPANKREMMNVAGVGEGKFERYGLAFLREIERYEMENGK